MTPLMIVADTYQQAYLYAREHELGPEGRGWRYACSPEQVRGYRGGQYVRVTRGTLSVREMRDRWDAIEVLRMHGFTHVEDS